MIKIDKRSREEMVYDVRKIGEKLIKEAEDIVGKDPDLGNIVIEINIDALRDTATTLSIERESYVF